MVQATDNRLVTISLRLTHATSRNIIVQVHSRTKKTCQSTREQLRVCVSGRIASLKVVEQHLERPNVSHQKTRVPLPQFGLARVN